MATSVNARASCWLDGIQVNSQDLRLQQASGMLTSAGSGGTTGIAATAGVRNAVGSPLAAVWQSGMGFNLNAGACFVQGTATAIAGLWNLTLDTTTLLTVTASDPTNPRIDSVIAVVVDNGNGTSTAQFKILAGTPAGSPVAPTLPANALRLWNIAVAANASVLSQPNFTDVRVWTVASGGILPYANAALGTAIGGPLGSYVHDLNTGRLRTLDGSGNAAAPKTAALAPVTASVTSGDITCASGSVTSLVSANVTVDGATEICALLNLSGIYMTTAVQNTQYLIRVYVDAALQYDWKGVAMTTLTGSGNAWGGGTFKYYLTPSSGTRAISFRLFQASGQSMFAVATSGFPLYMRISTESA